MKNPICQLLSAVLLTTLFAACSRPVAYFQRGPVDHYNTPKTETIVIAPTETAQSVEIDAPVTTAIVAPAEQVAQADAGMTQIEAYVRNDSKLVTDKKLTKRIDRVRTMLATASTNKALTPSAMNPSKMNGVERLMVKKVNKKISKHLAPTNPDKTMINGGLLAGGVVLLLVGLLLLLLTTGTGATVGVIAVILGAVALLFGLLAS